MSGTSSTRRNFLTKSVAAVSCAGAVTFASSLSYSASKKPVWAPKISENIGNLDESTLRWMAQLGLKHVVLQDNGTTVDRDGKLYWTVDDITAAQNKCREFELELATMMIPIEWYRKNCLGESGRDAEIDRIVRSVKSAGAAGIPVLEWRPTWLDFYWDKRVGYLDIPGRGGSEYRNFNYDRIKDLPDFDEFPHTTPEEMWGRMLYFGKPIVEAAEQAGVLLSIHPNDPPVPVLRGAPRIITSVADVERLFKEIPSPSNGLTFCQGTFSEMGVDVIATIKKFGSRINHIHLRGVRGTVPNYTEVFIDEGDVDMLEAMKTYREIGYIKTIVSDHTPRVEGGGRVGRSYSHGYIRSLVQAVNAVS